MDTLVKTGKPAPLFTLPDIQGKPHKLKTYYGKIVILNFWSAECPWSERADQALLPMLDAWGDQVVLLSIASNANETLEEITEVANQRGVDLVLHDADQSVARQYGAVTTPHVYIIDPHGKLRYQGAFDDVTFRQREPTVNYLHRAVEALLAEELPEVGEIPSYGCTVNYYQVS